MFGMKNTILIKRTILMLSVYQILSYGQFEGFSKPWRRRLSDRHINRRRQLVFLNRFLKCVKAKEQADSRDTFQTLSYIAYMPAAVSHLSQPGNHCSPKNQLRWWSKFLMIYNILLRPRPPAEPGCSGRFFPSKQESGKTVKIVEIILKVGYRARLRGTADTIHAAHHT